MTGQIVSPPSRAAVMSPTSALICCSMTAKTSSTVRPEAAMRARSAALICLMAAGRSRASPPSAAAREAGRFRVGAGLTWHPLSSQVSLLKRR